MRLYNVWYKELWWWIVENKEPIVGGFTIALVAFLAYVDFMKR
jgi:hypothetical protein